MKMPAKQNVLTAPLNRILGVESHVRILRELVRSKRPIGRSELARRIGLDPAGVRRSVAELMRLGVVEASGGIGRRGQQIRLRRKHPLSRWIFALFHNEGYYVNRLIFELRKLLVGCKLHIDSAWAWATDMSDDIPAWEVAVLAPLQELTTIQDEIQPRLVEIGRRFDVMLELKAYTKADLKTWDEAKKDKLVDAVLLYGVEPIWYAKEALPSVKPDRKPRTHHDIDRRLLRIGKAVAQKIAQDPSLVDRAAQYAAQMSQEAPPGERATMREWKAILDTQPISRVQYILGHPGERATRLRQSLPFLAVLTPAERAELLAGNNHDA